MDTETILLIIVTVGGLGAVAVGGLLLFMYFRYNNGGGYQDEPVVYGNLVQCPNCGYMNPIDAAACLNCRHPLAQRQGYQPPPPAPYSPGPPAGYGPPPAPGYRQAPAGPPPPASPAIPAPGYQVGPPSAAVPAPVSPSNGPIRPHEVPSAPSQPFPAQSAAVTDNMPRAWLEGVAGAVMGHHAMIAQPDTLVGRSTACDVQVYDPKVSRKHFLIRFANGAFFLQDQQSSRGTRINGQEITAQRLNDGDHIELGDSAMIFHIE